MRTSSVAILLLFTSAVSGAGCGSESATAALPTSPSTVAPPTTVVPAPVVTLPASLSGMVYDTANRTIAGATITVVDGAQAGLTTKSNASGQYWLTGTFEEGTRFRASREGYVDGESRLGPSCAPCNPHLWVSIYLALPIPPVNIAGDYTMTVDALAACTSLPADMRSRSYTATIVPEAVQRTAANTYFRVEMGGAPLMPDAVWAGLWIAVAGSDLELEMGDLHGQPGLIEQLGNDGYFSAGAWGRTTVASPATTFTSPFEGEIVYCVMKPGVAVLDANRRHDCGADRAISRIACPGGRLTFTRR